MKWSYELTRFCDTLGAIDSSGTVDATTAKNAIMTSILTTLGRGKFVELGDGIPEQADLHDAIEDAFEDPMNLLDALDDINDYGRRLSFSLSGTDYGIRVAPFNSTPVNPGLCITRDILEDAGFIRIKGDWPTETWCNEQYDLYVAYDRHDLTGEDRAISADGLRRKDFFKWLYANIIAR